VFLRNVTRSAAKASESPEPKGGELAAPTAALKQLCSGVAQEPIDAGLNG
jgi:hypothetical protein